MTTIERTRPDHLIAVTHDLYRDIHKAIRTELFSAVTEAARLDPSLVVARVALAAQVSDVVAFLVDHAEHEDGAIQPVLEEQLPDLAARVADDHEALDARMAVLVDMATEAALPDAPNPGLQVHALHLELASFTSDYLVHQDVEERVIMPALETAVGVPAVIGVHQAILAGISPQDMARSMAMMLPASNVDGRSEMLGGMKANAPAPAFEAMWSLAASVLEPRDLAAVAERIGVS